MEKGNELLAAMESFWNEIPWVSGCSRIFGGRFVFDVITDTPKTDDEIIDMWNDAITDFLKAHQKNYPLCNLRVCCGICSMDGLDVIGAIENASLARKESRKAMGHAPVIYTKRLLEGLNARRKKEVELIDALRKEKFTYFLQPIVDLKTGRIVGAEALARQIAADGTIMCPDSFLPIMEENGNVVELDFLILRKVCEELAKRIKNGQKVICTSVNLSRLHIWDRNTAEKINDIVSEYNIPSELLNFEITETIPMDEYSEAKLLIDELRENKYLVSIDDYGTGYTGISLWQDLDFDVIKMDRKFLSDDEDLKVRNTIIIPHTICLAKKMDIDVICEGVERQDQCEALIGWGCETAQGFYFSRPIQVDEFYKNYEESGGVYPLKFKVN